MLLCSLTSAVLICWASFETGDNSLYHVENDAKGNVFTYVRPERPRVIYLFSYFSCDLAVTKVIF